MNETIVIYHGSCRDGFCAAWVYNKYVESRDYEDALSIGNLVYHPGFYGQEPPNVIGKNIIILDFCYPLEVMKQIVDDCKSLIWLDHHKTAQPVKDWFISNILNDNDNPVNKRIKWDFDNNRSGAGITWDYFFPNKERPWIVNYVEDRDLWLKRLFASDAVNSYISCLKFDFNIWDLVNAETSISQAVGFGQIAEMKTEQYVREVCKNVYFRDIYYPEKDLQKILDDKVEFWKQIPIVNICQVDCSEVLHELCKSYPDSPFSLYWFKRHDGLYQYGLRSIGDFDVSSVTKLFGGGGHKNAAGFQLNYLLEELK